MAVGPRTCTESKHPTMAVGPRTCAESKHPAMAVGRRRCAESNPHTSIICIGFRKSLGAWKQAHGSPPNALYSATLVHSNRGIQTWFSRVVLESVLGIGFRFCCIENQSPVFTLVFDLVFATRSWSFNSPCRRTVSPNSTRLPCLKYLQFVLIQSLLHPQTNRGAPKRQLHRRQVEKRLKRERRVCCKEVGTKSRAFISHRAF